MPDDEDIEFITIMKKVLYNWEKNAHQILVSLNQVIEYQLIDLSERIPS